MEGISCLWMVLTYLIMLSVQCSDEIGLRQGRLEDVNGEINELRIDLKRKIIPDNDIRKQQLEETMGEIL